MNNDLLIIKKHYGEKMMHLCRELFSTILDNNPGALSKILLDNFAPNHYLYDDLFKNAIYGEANNYFEIFKDYIYYLYEQPTKNNHTNYQEIPDPVTLMHQVGYTLYECLSEKDIQSFKKYYNPGEELCTFNGSRLMYCYVYFAIREGAGKLNRSDFSNPQRQDEYGTSVISIQFTRDASHTLSIKNRYNHTVPNPDATFSNDLDNIVPGLTESFAVHYEMHQQHSHNRFELPGYIRANDGKFYKYNYEIDNIYYCPGNIVIDNFQVVKYPKEKYLVFDYFVLDLVNKTITCIIDDAFPKTIGKIKKISILNTKIGKRIIITNDNNQEIIIDLNKYQQIISYQNNSCEYVDDNFLIQNKQIESLIMNNVKQIGKFFLYNCDKLSQISLNNVETIGSEFLTKTTCLKKISFPKLKQIDNDFISWGNVQEVDLPEVTKIGNNFFRFNNQLLTINLPKVKRIGRYFLAENNSVNSVNLPEVISIGSDFFIANFDLSEINMPKVKVIGNNFLSNNVFLPIVDLPSLEIIGTGFLCINEYAVYVNLPNVKTIGNYFMLRNNMAEEFNAPNLKKISNLNHHFRKLHHFLQEKNITKTLKNN